MKDKEKQPHYLANMFLHYFHWMVETNNKSKLREKVTCGKPICQVYCDRFPTPGAVPAECGSSWAESCYRHKAYLYNNGYILFYVPFLENVLPAKVIGK